MYLLSVLKSLTLFKGIILSFGVFHEEKYLTNISLENLLAINGISRQFFVHCVKETFFLELWITL